MEVALPSNINWARYWAMKALEKVLGCDEVEAQTSAFEMRIAKSDNHDRKIVFFGKIRRMPFSVTCTLDLANPGATDEKPLWKFVSVTVTGRGVGGWTFFGRALPGYPSEEPLLA